MKKIVFMVLICSSLFGGMNMCLYYYKQIPPAQKKAQMALERGDDVYASIWIEQVLRNIESALAECDGIVPEENIQSLENTRKVYMKYAK